MFERLFGTPKSPEGKERVIQKVAEKEISELGVNSPGLWNAWEAVRKENMDKKLGLTNNHLLNIVRDTAIAFSGSIEDSMYGGVEQTLANIDAEINRFRQELTDEERRA